MKRDTVTLVGRAHDLTFDNGIASWKIAIRRSADPNHFTDFNLQASATSVLEEFERMDEGQLIGVIAELPRLRQRVPGAVLNVTRLELLGKPVAKVEG